MLQKGLVRKGFRETDVFFIVRTVTKEASHKGLESNWVGLALLSQCVQSPKEGKQRELFSHLNQNVTLKSFSGRKLPTSKHNNSG